MIWNHCGAVVSFPPNAANIKNFVFFGGICKISVVSSNIKANRKKKYQTYNGKHFFVNYILCYLCVDYTFLYDAYYLMHFSSESNSSAVQAKHTSTENAEKYSGDHMQSEQVDMPNQFSSPEMKIIIKKKRRQENVYNIHNKR